MPSASTFECIASIRAPPMGGALFMPQPGQGCGFRCTGNGGDDLAPQRLGEGPSPGPGVIAIDPQRNKFAISNGVNNGDTMLSGTQVGRDYSVSKGEAALVSASEALKMTGSDKNIWANVVVPRAVLADAFAHIDDRLALSIGADNEALDMLKRYCRFLDTGPAIASPDLITHVTETIVDLIGLATGAKGEAAELAGLRSLRAARLQAILNKIRDSFADPSVSAQGVAQQLRLSVRYVHDLLQETGMSFAERILELRLQKAHRMLSDRRNDRMLISEIALLSGFSDVSYFNRCFRRRFGSTPSSTR
ncbi:helix-turn-helix transcriptional regulator [Mesorhizobium sp. ANAO-SY3R2]|uniref:AraC family transcriptional regulator n=1 Tax=Mesorhizobium sp. ANAO-SY3R2 TaxID=3166644 RepID=UPI00366C0E02